MALVRHSRRTGTLAARNGSKGNGMRALKTTWLWTSMCLGAVVLAAGACTTRTVPLPPPIVEQLSLPDPDGMITVKGLCHEGASVGVMNEATQVGTITTSPETGCDSSCRWEARLAAEPDDAIRVWQFFETESSIEVTVPPRE